MIDDKLVTLQVRTRTARARWRFFPSRCVFAHTTTLAQLAPSPAHPRVPLARAPLTTFAGAPLARSGTRRARSGSRASAWPSTAAPTPAFSFMISPIRRCARAAPAPAQRPSPATRAVIRRERCHSSGGAAAWATACPLHYAPRCRPPPTLSPVALGAAPRGVVFYRGGGSSRRPHVPRGCAASRAVRRCRDADRRRLGRRR